MFRRSDTCGCSETLFSGIAPARLDQQESQPGRQRHFCNCLISKYFCYCRAFQLILVIERASSLPQLLSPAANWLIQAAPFILWRGDKFLSRSQTLVLSNAFLTGDNRKLLSVDLFSLEKGDKDGDWERRGHSKAIGLSRPYWWWLENPSNVKCL